MKSSKSQTPTSREHPATKHQTTLSANSRVHRRLKASSRLIGVGASLVLGCSCLVLSSSAQYTIDWHTIDGGGGTSTNGQYAVSGTIGQPEAGPTMTNGQYAVTGGFWAIHAIQTPGAPQLSITPAGPGQATVSWNPDTPGFVLQETLSLSPTNWTNSVSGSTNPVVVPATVPTKFYRLFKP